MRGPKLPAFDDANDNIDAYIQRFERYATSQKWNRDNWGAHLSALLKGKALDVFARLPPEDALDVDELKAALYKRFDMTEDGFRKRFRSSKPEGSETFLQFSSRMDSYLERWVELSKTKKNIRWNERPFLARTVYLVLQQGTFPVLERKNTSVYSGHGTLCGSVC